MAKFERELHAKASEVIKTLSNELSGLELIDSSAYNAGDATAYLFVYGDKESNHIQLTLLVVGTADSNCTVAAITSGCESDLTSSLERLTDRYG